MSDAAIAATGAATIQPSGIHAWKDPKGFGFRDLVDVVNPLQHIPIVSSIYRWITGDRPGEAAQIAGDGLYGGPIGVGIGLLSAAFEDSQGRDVGERALAAVFGSDAKTPAVAGAQPPGTAPSATANPAQAAASTPPLAMPDHPPKLLFGGIALPQRGGIAAAAAPQAQNTAARDFLARNAALEHEVAAAPRRASGATAPVPLVIPPGALQPPRLAVPAGAAVPPEAPGAPLDISHKMLDALDKYMQLEQERKAHPTAPDGGAPPAVDLSM